MTPHYSDPLVTLYLGDCLDVMRELPDASVDSVVTDPPYALGFMGKDWDSFAETPNEARWNKRNRNTTVRASAFKGGVATSGVAMSQPNPRCARCGKVRQGTAKYVCQCGDDYLPAPRENRQSQRYQLWCTEWATEAFRVLKPGGYMIAAGGTRTVHRLASAIEDAGFEIRDMLIWAYASGFPKSHNVTEALRRLPSCSCDVAGKVGTVDPGLPAGSVGAGVGAEPGAVPLTGRATDETPGVGSESRPRPGRRGRKVDADTVDLGWQIDPVVLGSPDVAGAAEGEQVVGTVSGVEADPEALRDQVVDDQVVDGPAVSTPAVPLEDGGGDDAPASSLVLPLAASPGGVPLAGGSDAVVGGHTESGAVDPVGVPPVSGEVPSADSTSEGRHAPDYTTENQALRCETCGGVRQERIIEGMGTALKPAFEPWVLARKPLVGTVAANMVRYGTGALNIGATRIRVTDGADLARMNKEGDNGWKNSSGGPNAAALAKLQKKQTTPSDGDDSSSGSSLDAVTGRWPSNVLLSDPELFDQPIPWVVGSGATAKAGGGINEGEHADIGYHGNGTWREQWDGYGDAGGYSRFFLVPKAPRQERNRGLTERSSHPTVKPIDLMRHLVRLVTPPGGTVLDPFAGSGTTGLAASEEGIKCILIERELEYCEIAVGRIMATPLGLGLFAGDDHEAA